PPCSPGSWRGRRRRCWRRIARKALGLSAASPSMDGIRLFCAVESALSARSGEREGPAAQQREGEVCVRRAISPASRPTSPSRRSRGGSLPLPPQAGGEGFVAVAVLFAVAVIRRPSRGSVLRYDARRPPTHA